MSFPLQASDQESLHALEGLMTEFFEPSTTNERKRQIGMVHANESPIKYKSLFCRLCLAYNVNGKLITVMLYMYNQIAMMFLSEELLNNFSQQRDAWRHCLFFQANTSNQYVSMYCMTVLEVCV